MNLTILIVDVQPESRHAIRDVAESLSLRPLLAATSEEARLIGQQEHPDLAICDLRLPDGPGTDLIPYLTGVNERCEVIVMTGGASFDTVVGAIRGGAADFLEKPFRAEDVSQALTRVLSRNSRKRVGLEPLQPTRALLLDDDLVTLKFMQKVLGDVGMVVHPVSTLEQARAVLGSQPIDVVLTDVYLQEGSGLDLVEELRVSHPSVPVIVVTGSTEPSVPIEALRRGAFDVVIKRVSPAELQSSILTAHRFRTALEERSRLERELERYAAGLAHLEQSDNRSRWPWSASAGSPSWAPPGAEPSSADTGLLRPVWSRATEIQRTPATGAGPEAATASVPDVPEAPSLAGSRGGTWRLSDELLRLALVGRFCSPAALSITTSLGISLGYVGLMTREGQELSKLVHTADKLQSTMKRASSLGSQWLRLIQPNVHAVSDCDLHALLTSALEIMERHLQSVNQTVQASLDARVIHVRADQDDLELLLVGMIDVVSRVATPGTLSVRTENDGDDVSVMFQLSGLAVAPSALDDSVDLLQATGDRLGLALCREFARHMHGRIGFCADVDGDWLFLLTFPAQAADPGPGGAAGQAPE